MYVVDSNSGVIYFTGILAGVEDKTCQNEAFYNGTPALFTHPI